MARDERALEGKVALVTGSTGGIGSAIARRLASDGASIVLHGYGKPERTERLRRSIAETNGVRVVYLHAELSSAAETADLVHDAQDALGSVDILVNNAGTTHVAPIEEQSTETWQKVLAVNLDAAFHTIKAVLPEMRSRNWGRIVNISSARGLVGGVDLSPYITSKFGLIGLTKAVAMETAATPITCNAVCPGFTSSPHVQKSITRMAEEMGVSIEDAETHWVSPQTPSGRTVKPEHVADVVGLLCSDAGAEVRGATWSIDGGWTAW